VLKTAIFYYIKANKGIKNAQFCADFKAIEKVGEKFTQNKLCHNFEK
jgi:hypothetical protein